MSIHCTSGFFGGLVFVTILGICTVFAWFVQLGRSDVGRKPWLAEEDET